MGMIFRPKYKMRLADGSVEERTVKDWHIQFQDAHGRTRRMKAGPMALAKELLAKMETEVARERRGLPTQNIAKVMLDDLMNRYLQMQKGKVCPDHYDGLKYRLETILKETKAIALRDLTPERVERYLLDFENGQTNPSPRTVNVYLQAVRGMLTWATQMRIIPYNPLACLQPRREEIKRKKRRAFSQEELERLFEAARMGPAHRARRCKPRSAKKDRRISETFHAQGERNTLIYRILAYTGLRVGELRQLRWGDLDMDEGLIRLRPETSKNRQGGEWTMPPILTELLRAWRRKHGDLADTEPVIEIPSTLLKSFNQDLKLAEIPKQDSSGRSVDLHALRHTYCTMLIKAGVDIKTVQGLMRHSTPVLTLGIYTHYDQSRLKEAVKKLPEVAAGEKIQQAQAG
jgi:integrase